MALRLLFAEALSGLTHEPPKADWLAQGLSMRDAVLADLLEARCDGAPLSISCGAAPHAPLPAGCGAARAIAPAPGEPAAGFVARQAAAHDAVWLIAPEAEDLLASLAEAVPAEKWIGCDTATLRLAGSKSRTTALLQARGLPTPLDFEADAGVSAWVVKPDDGVGASDARRHGSLEAARADLAQRPGCVLEPWVDGDAMSLALLCGAGQAELLSVNRQAIGVGDDGWLVEQGVVPLRAVEAALQSSLAALAQRVAAAMPGLAGFVGIDFVLHARRGPVLVEVNPRVTSVYAGLRAVAARNLAQTVLDRWAGAGGATRAGSPPAR